MKAAPVFVLLGLGLAALLLYGGPLCRLAGQLHVLAAMPLRWRALTEHSVLSAQTDDFDLSFARYDAAATSEASEGASDATPHSAPDSATESTSDQASGATELAREGEDAPEGDKVTEDDALNVVPPILHQIHLGERPLPASWQRGMASCWRLHADYEHRLWNDSLASEFVRARYPQLAPMWHQYRYPVQRVDSLRYMLLDSFGGIILDMDMECKRSLAPLRRFHFVAPAAHPAGFSVGMMMAARGQAFVRQLVANLEAYNRNWFGLPYVTVMFSTGCHYASAIYTLQPDRSQLRILMGPPDQPTLHMLNGNVSTPLFNHFGSSTWHSADAFLFVAGGRGGAARARALALRLPIFLLLGLLAARLAFVFLRRQLRKRRADRSLKHLTWKYSP